MTPSAVPYMPGLLYLGPSLLCTWIRLPDVQANSGHAATLRISTRVRPEQPPNRAYLSTSTYQKVGIQTHQHHGNPSTPGRPALLASDLCHLWTRQDPSTSAITRLPVEAAENPLQQLLSCPAHARYNRSVAPALGPIPHHLSPPTPTAVTAILSAPSRRSGQSALPSVPALTTRQPSQYSVVPTLTPPKTLPGITLPNPANLYRAFRPSTPSCSLSPSPRPAHRRPHRPPTLQDVNATSHASGPPLLRTARLSSWT